MRRRRRGLGDVVQDAATSVGPGAASPGDPNVRFHKSRPGEVWLEDDLKGYVDEAILVFETPESDPASTHVH